MYRLDNIIDKGVNKKLTDIEVDIIKIYCQNLIELYVDIPNHEPLVYFEDLPKSNKPTDYKGLAEIFKDITVKKDKANQEFNSFISCILSQDQMENLGGDIVKKIEVAKARIIDAFYPLRTDKMYNLQIKGCFDHFRIMLFKDELMLLENLPDYSQNSDDILTHLNILEKLNPEIKTHLRRAHSFLSLVTNSKWFDICLLGTKRELVNLKNGETKPPKKKSTRKNTSENINAVKKSTVKGSKIKLYVDTESSEEIIDVDKEERIADQSVRKQYFTPDKSKVKSINKSLKLQAILAKDRSTHIISKGKLSICDYSKLTNFEVKTFFQYCLDNMAKQSSCIYILISLFTGRSVEHIYKILFCKEKNYCISEHKESSDNYIFFEYAPKLPDHITVKKFRHLIDRPVGKVMLVLPGFLLPQLNTLLRNEVSEKDYLDEIKKVMKSFSKKHITRVTLARLGGFLEFKLKNNGVSPADIALICGLEFFYNPGIYYYKLKTQKLIDIHSKYINELLEGVNCKQIILDDISSKEVGSNLIVKKDEIKKFILKIQSRLEYLSSTPLVVQGHYEEHHNLFVMYTLLILNFATGHRSVRDPYETIDTFDLVVNTVLINDKEVSNQTSFRVLPIPKICSELVIKYHKHLTKLFSMGSLRDNNSNKFILGAIEGNQPLFFFIEGGNVEEAFPAKLKQLYIKYWPIPLNWNRHFMYSTLMNSEFSGEIVSGWMGHEIKGDNVLEVYSNISISKLREIASFIGEFLIYELEINIDKI